MTDRGGSHSNAYLTSLATAYVVRCSATLSVWSSSMYHYIFIVEYLSAPARPKLPLLDGCVSLVGSRASRRVMSERE